MSLLALYCLIVILTVGATCQESSAPEVPAARFDTATAKALTSPW